MTQEERDLIARFVARVGGSPQSGSFIGGGGSVPQAQATLPPIDREADSFIADQMQRYPEARYRITQMAVVQEAALTEMNNRLQRLQWELEQAKQQQQPAPQPAKSGGLFGGLFGGGASQPQQRSPAPGSQQGGPWGPQGVGYGQQQYAPPPPQYPSQYQPGMFNRGGSGFLGSALTTAAGVAGGMVVGNALMNAFGGSHGGGVGEAMAAPTGGFLGGSDAGTTAFDGAGVDPSSDFTSNFGNDQGSFGGGGGFDTASNDGFDGGGGGGFDGGGGGGFDGGGGGGGGFDNS